MATNRSFYLLTALLFAALLLLLVWVAINNWPVLNMGVNLSGSKEARDIPRAQAAYSARMNGLFMVYLDEAKQAKRARDAETARWNAMAAHYLTKQAQEAEQAKRARDAETARWNAMAAYYLAKQAQEVE